MTVRLTVRTAVWRAHVARVAHRVEGLVPVVKGNGYGFGRATLAQLATELADTLAVGTVHELPDLPGGVTAVVLTPTLRRPDTTAPILTVGRREHVAALAGWEGRVIVKLASSMRRYGGDPTLIEAARSAGLDVVGVSVHPPLAGTPDDHRDEIAAMLPAIPTDLPVWVSHLDPPTYATLPPSHRYRLRLGTLLWHGDKSALSLHADVLDVRRVAAGQTAGYRLTPVDGDGHLVMIGAGTANGVTPLTDGRSPFHFRRQRLALHEPPHMHTSMAHVPHGVTCPQVGDWVDVQRPLTTTTVDVYQWV